MRHSLLCAALVIVLMSKQFIPHLLGPFLESFKEILYGCGIQHSGCDGVESGGRLQVHARSRRAVFVSGPSTLEVDILLDHYHTRPTPPSIKPMLSLLLPHTSITHHLLLSQPHVSPPPLPLLLPPIRQSPPLKLATALHQHGFSH